MVKVVIVSKGGSLKESSVKNFNEADLYKKGGFRKSTDFSKRIKWRKSSTENVSLYAKDNGRAGSENKYELPPPIDKELYFGSLVIVLQCVILCCCTVSYSIALHCFCLYSIDLSWFVLVCRGPRRA